MARLVPEAPAFVTASERQVWERLRDTLPADAVLLANLRLTDETKDHEADVVVLLPGTGIVVLEVKGGAVWHDEEGWWVRRGPRTDRCSPVDQAREAKYALRAYVEADPRWGSRGRVVWSHGVVTPHSAFGDAFSVPELPRWALHDRHDQADLVARLSDNGRGLAHGHRAPTHDDVEMVVQVLAGRHHTTYDVNAEAEERARRADLLTQEQMAILGVTRMLRRVEVRGGAGSGKTVLALQKARELSHGGHGQRAERVALLCYSVGLGAFLKRQVEGWPRRHRPAFVGTYEELGRRWGIEMGTRDDSDFWENRLPRLMAARAAELPDGHRFDAVVVDEAQDFADTWWPAVTGALRDEDHGGVFCFSDENQRLFARFGRPPMQLVPLVLDHNLRNTRQICEAFGPLAPSRMRALGADGPEVRFVATDAEELLGAADDAVEQLLHDGWEPARIALLTTGHRHPEQQAQVERHGHEGYWRSFWDGADVFYGHVLGSKGLERSAVVLCVNEVADRDRARERLYVGMSRATDLLVVVADPEVLRRAAGGEVARRLGLPALPTS